MESLQLKSGDKVKLILEQPDIMCEGRKLVTCHYRGTVRSVFLEGHSYLIRFKHKGIVKDRVYRTNSGFDDPELKDIKLRL